MTIVTAVFHGTERQTRDLLDAIGRNCHCPKPVNNIPDGSCFAHRLMYDQRVLDGLLYARNQLDHLREQEFAPTPGDPA